ncbi:hypothetical protein MAR_025306 [Mya arenaria]|uniref:Uncharacterized protein n=1 Tax=Mya arenaria TaxID=6604 RepID=A0ABY7DTR4_MYAAR|nr:hypothetical protein MAR_025197 [Mya arenaria]WAR00934.1 hypothetical protein MAR_025306 [Mya arenaria]
MKPIPDSIWVWELQERLETVHNTVRQATGHAMKRQKQIRDKRNSYEHVDIGDKVLVYFPVRKPGKLSDVLYKVDCGRKKAEQVIHCDQSRVIWLYKHSLTWSTNCTLQPSLQVSCDANGGRVTGTFISPIRCEIRKAAVKKNPLLSRISRTIVYKVINKHNCNISGDHHN